jgi:hypothetical protein
MAYATALVLVQVDRFAARRRAALGSGEVSKVIVRTLQAAAPETGRPPPHRCRHAGARAGATHRYAGLVFGLVGALISGSTFFGQLERGLKIASTASSRTD